MIPSTANRVAEHTAAPLNEKIRQKTNENIEMFKQSDLVAIEDRLEELDKEWDIERKLQTNFALVSLIGLGLSKLSPKWLLLTASAAGFMVEHAFQGWCPPLSVFRRLGVRSYKEIDDERFALMQMKKEYEQAQLKH
jgi:hypothetical protein